MTVTIEIAVPASHESANYPIWIGADVLPSLEQRLPLERYSNVTILTDSNVAPYWLSALQHGELASAKACVIPAGEEHKNLNSLQLVWEHLHNVGCDRRSLLLNLGGGVIGDLGGFAASTYMRGIDFVQLPTTLLSQVDASVGGKVGCNFNEVKNLLGAFNQPQAVCIDTNTLKTLPSRELQSGWAEVIKHGLIRDTSYLQMLAEQPNEETQSSAWLARVIECSCRLKAEVVTLDEREGGLRKILNFGHTVGHAIESLSHQGDSPYLHGEAIALGMVAEAEISRLQGFISEGDVVQIEQLLSDYQLPVRLKASLPWEAVQAKMLTDKKNVGGSLRWTLLQSVGQAVFDVEVEEPLVKSAIARLTRAPQSEENLR